MELNEVKSQLAGLMNFGRISVSSGVGNDAFAQMLNFGAEDGRAEVRENDRTAAEAKSGCSERREVRSDDKSSASDRKVKSAKNNKRKVVDKDDVSPDGVARVSREDMQSRQNEKVSCPDGEDVVGGVVSDNAGDESEKMSDSARVPLSDLSMMGVIDVVNSETGEMVRMTGAELSARLAGNDSVQILMSTSQNGEPVFKIQPASAAQNVMTAQVAEADGGVDAGAFVPVDDAGVIDLNAEAVNKEALTQNFADDLAGGKAGEQEVKLSEVIGRESKVDVKVSVHEEKIAQLSARDLLADVGSVDEAITVSSKPAAVSAQNVAEMSQSQGSWSAVGDDVQNLIVAPVFNAAVSSVSEAGMANVSAAANAEMGSAGLGTTVTVVSGEFVRAAKADVASENGQTSFRDVYKGMGREAVEQVKVNITKSAVKGIDKIDISLKPEDLGHVEIKMQIGRDGKLQAHIISTRPETMEALQKEMQSLEKAFNDAGFQTDEGSLSFSFRDGNQANQNQERENGLRSFIGDMFEKEAGNDLLADAFQNQSWDGTAGLNIRV